jgi:hypothetical protein
MCKPLAVVIACLPIALKPFLLLLVLLDALSHFREFVDNGA